MDPWPPPSYQRALAYVTDPAGRLLVFDHIDNTLAGTQVPGGGIKPDESPEQACLRELAEEAGTTTAQFVRKLGEGWWHADVGDVPAGLEEVVQHVFHLRVDEAGPDTYDWDDYDGGTELIYRFRCSWTTIDEAATALWPSQQMWLPSLRVSLRY
jgi:8-oxo-dGTP pyrophosphatase MutT (NUDIX family)